MHVWNCAEIHIHLISKIHNIANNSLYLLLVDQGQNTFEPDAKYHVNGDNNLQNYQVSQLPLKNLT